MDMCTRMRFPFGSLSWNRAPLSILLTENLGTSSCSYNIAPRVGPHLTCQSSRFPHKFCFYRTGAYVRACVLSMLVHGQCS